MKAVRRAMEPVALPLQSLLVGVAVGAVMYTAIVIVPIYLKAYEFEEATHKETQLAATNLDSNNKIRNDLYQKAADLGLPVDMNRIKVNSLVTHAPIGTVNSLMNESAPTHETADVDIDVAYAVPLKFPGHIFHLNFHVHDGDYSSHIDH
ncbi:MAG TPA: hypothetical protein VJO53_10280 [Candidatus Acidoferrales bacterium]|nr:hypothetical protein [Candidatus Acidoferrales bacterium]